MILKPQASRIDCLLRWNFDYIEKLKGTEAPFTLEVQIVPFRHKGHAPVVAWREETVIGGIEKSAILKQPARIPWH